MIDQPDVVSDARFLARTDRRTAPYFQVLRRTTLRRIDRSLARAGLERTGLFWVRGTADRFTAAVPLDRPGPLLWYLDRVVVPQTARRKLAEAVARLAVRAGPRVTVPFAGQVAVTAVPAGETVGPLAGPLSAPGIGADLVGTEPRPLFLGHGDALNRTVVLPFSEGARGPSVVLKVGRVPARNESTRREQHELTALHDDLPADLRGTIPAPLGLFEWDGLTVGLETVAPGRPLNRKIEGWPQRASAQRAALREATEWLIRFTTSQRPHLSRWDAQIDDWVERPIAMFKAEFAPDAEVATRLSELRDVVGEWGDRRVPIVTVHWGFRANNMFTSRSGLHVIDWEAASPGPPLYDLLFFLFDWLHAARLPERYRELSALIAGRDHVDDHNAKAALQSIDDYLHALALEWDVVPVLYALLCMLGAVGRARRGRRADASDYVAEVRAVLTAGEVVAARR